jgi:outer membrane protein assembly factor BamB
MKLLNALLILFFLNSCSFDDKSGIWKNENDNIKEKKDIFKDFKKVTSFEESFNKIIPFSKKTIIQISKPVISEKWNDIHYDFNNNLKNFQYNDVYQVILKSKKLSKNKVNDYLLFSNNHLIINDEKGNIIIYSINKRKIITKFNFYKKKYKKIKKILNLIVEKDIVYISDNLGYLYAINYKTGNIIWAKNYKIPFRSNLKIINDQIIAANQNNYLYFFNKKNGESIKFIPTEETIIKNAFINNLSINNEKSIFFLNTYGSLYSIDIKTLKINWFINLNQSTDINPSNLFDSVEIVSNKSKVLISSINKTFIIDSKLGLIIDKFNFSPLFRPIINKNYVFLITKNNLLISIDLNTSKILYSLDINDQIANFLNLNKKEVKIKSFMLVNNEIIIFLKNSYILNFKINGTLRSVRKLPFKLISFPIIIDNSFYFLNNKNKLIIMN